MKKAIKIALTTMVIMYMMLGAMHWFKSHQEEKRLIRQEQERMAEHTIENFEDIKKIEFTSFEQNFSTRTWSARAIINNKISVSYSVDVIGEESPIRIIADISRNEDREGTLKERNNEVINIDISNIEVIYKRG
ncbi:hypothetical protein [Gemella morbillorum]|uniref:hypothetical protein n=1 Tax=Gemella morbillorum TaxID=29391 RepID=UPI0028D5576B|nr:hypothetical protein [Gemella morbillorum]